MTPPPASPSLSVDANPFRRSTGKTLDALIDRSAPPWQARRPLPLKPGEALLGEPEQPAVEGMPSLDPMSPGGIPESKLAEWEADLEERDRQLRRTKVLVDEKERAVHEQEMLLKARERYLQESEHLFLERQKAIKPHAENVEAEKSEPPAASEDEEVVTAEVEESFNRLKKELDQREERIKQSELMMEEREAFVLESEQVLFEKAQQLHELETELDSLRDELRLRKAKLDARDGDAGDDEA